LVTPEELQAELQGATPPRVVDVREPDEWAICRIPGAELIPLSQFAQRGPEELDEDANVVVYCHHGMRSAKAQAFLRQRGFARVRNLDGGIDAWAARLDPAMRRY
jgi:adenylyltransferase/sulfurtransferase